MSILITQIAQSEFTTTYFQISSLENVNIQGLPRSNQSPLSNVKFFLVYQIRILNVFLDNFRLNLFTLLDNVFKSVCTIYTQTSCIIRWLNNPYIMYTIYCIILLEIFCKLLVCNNSFYLFIYWKLLIYGLLPTY